MVCSRKLHVQFQQNLTCAVCHCQNPGEKTNETKTSETWSIKPSGGPSIIASHCIDCPLEQPKWPNIGLKIELWGSSWLGLLGSQGPWVRFSASWVGVPANPQRNKRVVLALAETNAWVQLGQGSYGFVFGISGSWSPHERLPEQMRYWPAAVNQHQFMSQFIFLPVRRVVLRGFYGFVSAQWERGLCVIHEGCLLQDRSGRGTGVPAVCHPWRRQGIVLKNGILNYRTWRSML